MTTNALPAHIKTPMKWQIQLQRHLKSYIHNKSSASQPHQQPILNNLDAFSSAFQRST